MTQDHRDPGLGKMRDGEPRLSLHVAENESGSASSYDGVGAMLREQRERSGESLEEASQRLRIRFPHLQAIEQGRFDDLPGRIYAIGFVRTYAEYLGLDAAATIELYKQETAGEEHSPKLVFPTPTAESRMPKVWLVAVSVLAAVVVYGGWHMSQDSGRTVVETVPPVPDQLLAQGGDAAARPAADSASASTPVQSQSESPAIEKKPAAVKQDEKPVEIPKPVVAAAEPEPQPAPAADAASEEPPQSTLVESQAETETAIEEADEPIAETAQSDDPDPAPPSQRNVQSDSPSSEETPAAVAAAEPSVETETAAAASTADDDDRTSAFSRRARVPITRFTDPSDIIQPTRRQAPEDEPAGDAAQVAAVSPPLSPARTAPPPLPPSAASADGATSDSGGLGANGYVPRVFGGNGSDGRVIVTATMDSWVQVRSGDNELLLTRILRAGDRYQAPDRSDLVLMTGNAGGLEIRVDGKLVPSIGPVGEVRRDISLDAGSLLERTSSSQ